MPTRTGVLRSSPHRTLRYWPGEGMIWIARLRGEAFRTRFGLRRYAYLLGPRANAFVFANDRLFRFREAYELLIPVDGPTSLIVSDGSDHTRRRALVRPGLHRRQVTGYLTAMSACADEALDGIDASKPFDAYQIFRAAIRRSTLRSLFGERIAARADEIGDMLQPALDRVDRMPEAVELHRRLRTPRWRRAMRSRALLDEFVFGEIDRIRTAPADAETHVLATLVHGRDGSGSGLSDDEIRDQIVTMIAAGYETTSGAMAWTLYGLGCRPDLMEQVREEVLRVTGGRPPTAQDLPRLELLGAVINEALRLYTPATMIPRYVVEDFEFAGKRIRAGTTALISPYVTHRSPELYADPLEFRPERWLEAGWRPSPSEFLPFGGGAHHCVGSVMATTEITVMLARLLTRSTYEVLPQKVRARSLAALRPANGLQIRLAAPPD